MFTLNLVHETVLLHDAMRTVNNTRSLEIFDGGISPCNVVVEVRIARARAGLTGEV